MNTRTSNIINGLSELIMQDNQRLKSEEQHPSASADQMDDRIKFFSKRVDALRELRDKFEDLMAQVTP